MNNGRYDRHEWSRVVRTVKNLVKPMRYSMKAFDHKKGKKENQNNNQDLCCS